MKELIEIVQQVAQAHDIDDCAVFSFAGDTYAFLFLGYYPQEEGALMVDNYYPAYQRVRKARVDLENALPISLKRKEIAHGYKGLAILSGKVRALRNSLTAIDGWGSQFVMEAVCVEGEWAPKTEIPAALSEEYENALADRENALYGEAWYRLCTSRLHARCEACDLCVKACPQGAIGARFDRDKCLRQMQSAGYVEDEKAAKRMGQRVLGCHTCQKVCPLNTLPAVPAEIDGAELLKAAIEGKKALAPFADCLGNNYLRPAKLVALALNALTNAKDPRWRGEALKARERYADERVQKAVDRYLSETPDIEREVKYMLDKADYERFVARAAQHDAKTHTQVNYYFDAGEYARARIRLKAGVYQLTLKRRVGKNTMQEHNADIPATDVERCLEKGLEVDYVHGKLGLTMPQSATYEGNLTTERTVWVEDGLRFELDKSDYLGKTDYEIECEVTSDEEWQRAEKTICAFAPTAREGKGKQSRFEAEKRAGR